MQYFIRYSRGSRIAMRQSQTQTDAQKENFHDESSPWSRSTEHSQKHRLYQAFIQTLSVGGCNVCSEIIRKHETIYWQRWSERGLEMPSFQKLDLKWWVCAYCKCIKIWKFKVKFWILPLIYFDVALFPGGNLRSSSVLSLTGCVPSS